VTDRFPAESIPLMYWRSEYPARMESEELEGRGLHVDCREIGCVDCWKAQSATDRGLSAECRGLCLLERKTL
jgi:hypothetical protein